MKGDFVEVAFQTQSGTVQGMAEMLCCMRSARDKAAFSRHSASLRYPIDCVSELGDRAEVKAPGLINDGNAHVVVDGPTP